MTTRRLARHGTGWKAVVTHRPTTPGIWHWTLTVGNATYRSEWMPPLHLPADAPPARVWRVLGTSLGLLELIDTNTTNEISDCTTTGAKRKEPQ